MHVSLQGYLAYKGTHSPRTLQQAESLSLLYFVDFVDFDLIDRIDGVSPRHPHARTGFAICIQTHELY